MFARKRVDARGRVRRELRIEVGEDVELRVERVRDRHVVLVAAGPVERLRARHALQVVDVDLARGEHRELLVPEVVADDAHHRDVGEEARREREVGRRSAEHPFALSERGLERVEGDGSDDGDGHADGGYYGLWRDAADLALRRDRPLLGRVQHRGPGDRVLPALRRARPARAGCRVRHGPLAHPVAEGRSRCRGRGRLGGHARAVPRAGRARGRVPDALRPVDARAGPAAPLPDDRRLRRPRRRGQPRERPAGSGALPRAPRAWRHARLRQRGAVRERASVAVLDSRGPRRPAGEAATAERVAVPRSDGAEYELTLALPSLRSRWRSRERSRCRRACGATGSSWPRRRTRSTSCSISRTSSC